MLFSLRVSASVKFRSSSIKRVHGSTHDQDIEIVGRKRNRFPLVDLLSKFAGKLVRRDH